MLQLKYIKTNNRVMPGNPALLSFGIKYSDPGNIFNLWKNI